MASTILCLPLTQQCNLKKSPLPPNGLTWLDLVMCEGGLVRVWRGRDTGPRGKNQGIIRTCLISQLRQGGKNDDETC